MSSAITAAVVGLGTAVYSAEKTSDAVNKGKKFKQRALDEEKRQYDLTREDWAPWRDLGTNAIANLEDPEAYKKSPGYQFRIDEGTRNRENMFSMKGGGGNAMRALEEYAQNFASNDYYLYRDDQRANAGLGTSGAQGSQFANQNYARGVGGHYDDMASLDLWGSNAKTNAVNAGISNLLYGAQSYASSRKPKTKSGFPA